MKIRKMSNRKIVCLAAGFALSLALVSWSASVVFASPSCAAKARHLDKALAEAIR